MERISKIAVFLDGEPVRDLNGKIRQFFDVDDLVRNSHVLGNARSVETRIVRGVCLKCGAPLFSSKNPDYVYECFDCDEDYYAFEQAQ